MIVTIPVDGKTMSACINKAFGRTQYFLVYNTETQEKTFLENAAANAPGGAGVQASQFVVDQNTDAVLAPTIGQNSADVIKSSGIKIYLTSGCSIQDNITAFLDGKLKSLTDIHAGFHDHGGR
ncbi:MAG: NifB/NifX family molybdenum-iron cluster-binding protein [Clostridiales bacterium]|nr:NifB/NifX family molybdenum-iron cluster-binding protein [Clostridiales bacterium]